MYSVMFVFLSDLLAVMSAKRFNVGHWAQTFQPMFFPPAPLMALLNSTTILYHFQWPCSCSLAFINNRCLLKERCTDLLRLEISKCFYYTVEDMCKQHVVK